MVATEFRTARHLHVQQQLGLAGRARQLLEDRVPPGVVVRVAQADGLEAVIQPLEVLAQAGGRPEHVCRITAYCCDRAGYIAARPALADIWRRRMGRHYPAMSMIFVADLLDNPAVIELEATAVVPAG